MSIHWSQHALTVEGEIRLHDEMVQKGRVPTDNSRRQRLAKDLAHCQQMAKVRRK